MKDCFWKRSIRPYFIFLAFLLSVAGILTLEGCSTVSQMKTDIREGGVILGDIPWAVEVYPEKESIYWIRGGESDTDSQILYRTTYDGDTTEVIAGSSESIGGEVNILDVALDRKRNSLYWSNQEGEIKHASLDGSREEVIYGEAPHPTRVAVDPEQGVLYWMTSTHRPAFCKATTLTEGVGCDAKGVVKRAELDFDGETPTLEKETVKRLATIDFMHVQSLLENNALEVDGVNEEVFYGQHTGLFQNSIRRLQGGKSRLFTEIIQAGGTGQQYAGRVGFDLSPSEQAVYYSDSSEDRILKAPYNSPSDTSAVVPALNATDVALDMTHGAIFWTNVAGVHRAGLDDGEKQVVFPDSLVAQMSNLKEKDMITR